MTRAAELPSTVDAPPERDEARRRNVALALSALSFPLLAIVYDVVTRRTLFFHVKPALIATYLAGVLVSLLVWGLGLEAARHPKRAVRIAVVAFLAFTASFGVGGQAFFRGITNGYVNRDAVLLALGVQEEVTGYVSVHALRAAQFFLPPALLIAAIAIARTRRFGPRRRHPWLFVLGTVVVLFTSMFGRFRADWVQCLPPDVLWLHASGGPLLLAIGKEKKPQTLPPGRHEEVPATRPVPDDAPSIVVLLGESVRRDEVCLPGAADCSMSPRLEAAAPHRIGFARASSVASCTELASVTLWSGMAIDADPKALARAPLLWDWAKSKGYRTAYLSSQNLLFQNLGLYLKGTRIDFLREGRDRDPAPNIDLGTPDELATQEALEFIEKGGPSFTLVHFSNTHLPYRQVEGFTPYPTGAAAPRSEERRNAYRNGLRHNDAVIGDFLTQLRKGPRGRRTIVISLSDHGEAWSEHGAVTHSWDLYAEEIDIPLWIDAPPGTLPDAVVERLKQGAASRPVLTPDISATVVDLMGGLDEPALAAQTAELVGTSLLRDPPAERLVPLWNCTKTRPCIYHSFGLFAWPLKLHYVGRDFRYVCSDLEADPLEKTAAPPARCAELRKEMARRWPGDWLDIEVYKASH
jgi:glucan phosphoethanolaminetransferase (alkaline phosphatase superfamily)